VYPDKRLHLLVPRVVIDELDGIKNKGENFKWWRAAYTLGVLERIFSPEQPMPELLQNGERGTRGAIDMERSGSVSALWLREPSAGHQQELAAGEAVQHDGAHCS
jgi:hypothetical protein